MGKVDDWLSTVSSKFTRKNYASGLRKFEIFYQQPVEKLIRSPDASKVVRQFYVWLKEKHCQNTARNQMNTVVQFLKFYDTEVKIPKDFWRTVLTTRAHLLTIEHIQQMAKTANLREQVLLEVYLLGLRISDVATLEWKTFAVQGESPIGIRILTRKEQIVAETFISQEFEELLNKYSPTLDKSNRFLFQSKHHFKSNESTGHLSVNGITKIFHDLAKRAGINGNGQWLRWHSGRSLFLRTATELGISPWMAKRMCGKAIPKSDDTYLQGMNPKEAFVKISEVLRLFSKVEPHTVDEIKSLKDALVQLERENKNLHTRIQVLQDRLDQTDNSMKEMFSKFDKRLRRVETKKKIKPKLDFT